MVRIQHAVLHAFDLDTGHFQLSSHELDLSERVVSTYVRRMMLKLQASPDNAPATIDETLSFATELRRYAQGARSLVDFSQDLASTLWEQMRMSENAAPCDVLVVDFTSTEKRPSDSDASSDSTEAPTYSEASGASQRAKADAEDISRHMFALVVLPRRHAFMHDLSVVDGQVAASLLTSDAALPNPTQKLTEYLLVDIDTLKTELVDEGVTIGGRSVKLLAEKLLHCSVQPSTHQVVDTVVRIAGDLAEDAGRSASLAMADAKDYVVHSAQQSTAVLPEEIGEHIFTNEPELVGRFVEAVRSEGLPDEISVKPSVANRLARNHRIRTDTGIDITFPSAYAADQHFIEFSREGDGSIQIVIHAASIENR